MNMVEKLKDVVTPPLATWAETFAEVKKILDDPKRPLTVVALISEDDIERGFAQPFYFAEWRPKLGEPQVLLGYLEDLMKMSRPDAHGFRLMHGPLEFHHPYMMIGGEDHLCAVIYR